jgi:hypothetical protein
MKVTICLSFILHHQYLDYIAVNGMMVDEL